MYRFVQVCTDFISKVLIKSALFVDGGLEAPASVAFVMDDAACLCDLVVIRAKFWTKCHRCLSPLVLHAFQESSITSKFHRGDVVRELDSWKCALLAIVEGQCGMTVAVCAIDVTT